MTMGNYGNFEKHFFFFSMKIIHKGHGESETKLIFKKKEKKISVDRKLIYKHRMSDFNHA